MKSSAINCLVGYSIAALVSALVPSATHGQPYPERPVRIVVGSSAGGPIDLVARLTAQKLSEAFNQQFVVENRVGAGGTIAGNYVAKAAPGGYILYMGSAATLCIAPAVYPKLPYDSLTDFAPIGVIAGTAFLMVVHPSVPAQTVKAFIALAKSRPGDLRFGSAGNGSGTHLSVELFKSMAKINVVHVPYKGGALAIVDVLSGQIEFMFPTIGSALSYVKSGKLRPLGVTGPKRSSVLPKVPTIAEAGVPGYESTTWFGLLGPAGMPADRVNALGSAARKAVETEEFKQRMLNQALEPVGNTPEQFAELIRRELPKWAEVVRSSKARAN